MSAQQAEMDGKFTAMHRTVLLLKKYGQKLPDKTQGLFNAAPGRWNNLKTKVSLAKQRLGPRIQEESVSITRVCIVAPKISETRVLKIIGLLLQEKTYFLFLANHYYRKKLISYSCLTSNCLFICLSGCHTFRKRHFGVSHTFFGTL